jgi:hypothetical protein
MNFKEEIGDIKRNGYKNLQVSIQEYVIILLIIMTIPIIVTIDKHFDLITHLITPISIDANFMSVAGVLATIVSIFIGVSWLIIQNSTVNQNNILMWIWIRDGRFLSFIIVSFSTVFLLIILPLTNISIYRIGYGIIYYIIFLNFMLYVLYLKAFSKVINPKHTVDLILKTREMDDSDNDLTDAESRLLAVYEIIRKKIEEKDIYSVIKCLNIINKNLEEYWLFKNDGGDDSNDHITNIRLFLDMLKKLKESYSKCSEELLLHDKGKCEFKRIIKKCEFEITISEISRRLNGNNGINNR